MKKYIICFCKNNYIRISKLNSIFYSFIITFQNYIINTEYNITDNNNNLIKYTNIYSFDTLPIILIYKRYKHCKLYKEIFTILVFTYFQLF